MVDMTKGFTPAPEWVINPPGETDQGVAYVAVRVDLDSTESALWSNLSNPESVILVLQSAVRAIKRAQAEEEG